MEQHVAIQCFLAHVPFGALGAAKFLCFLWGQIMLVFDLRQLVLGELKIFVHLGHPKRDVKLCFFPWASTQDIDYHCHRLCFSSQAYR